MSDLKYEYTVLFYERGQNVDMTDGDERMGLQNSLNVMGNQGWELVAVDSDNFFYYFKRLKKTS